LSLPTENKSGPDVTGWMIYVKLSVTGNEPDYVKDYRRRFPDFPHQSTGDQVFEKDQFEAYLRLEEHVADDIFSEELIGEDNRATAIANKLSVTDWYHQLAGKFLRDTD